MRRVLAAALCAVFALGLAFVLVTDAEAGRKARTVSIKGMPHGDTYGVDSNRKVPVIVTRATGYAEMRMRYAYGKTKARILVHPRVWHGSKCTLRKVIRHEKAHAAGWGHYERPKHKNPAFSPTVRVC